MAVMPGMEHLKPAKVIGWIASTGHLMALCKNNNEGDDDKKFDVKEFEMFIDPTGKLFAREFVPDITIDQMPPTVEEQAERTARRWVGVDQT
jgi:hypothetical protein